MVGPKAYRYGWEAFPVAVVVWDATDLKLIRQLDKAVTIDAFVIRKEERQRFRHGLAEGAYRSRYRQANLVPFEGRYDVFVREPAGP